MSSNDNQIVFWGPRSSGKTWLFQAFLKKVQILNRGLAERGSLKAQENNNGRWVDVRLDDNPKIDPTSDLYQSKYRLIRNLNGKGIFSEVNNHCNEILVADNTGGVFDKSKQDDPFAVEQAKNIVADSRYLILSLNSGVQENAKQGAIVENLRDLARMIENGVRGKYIAACLTKVDMLGGELIIEFYNRNKAELKSLLIRSFGAKYVDQIYEVIDQIRGGGVNRVELFATSASGYYTENEKKIANVSANKLSLADYNQWHPEEVERPFFWLFDVMERERLKYLPIRWNAFQLLKGKDMIAESRRAEYLPYEMLIRIAQSRS